MAAECGKGRRGAFKFENRSREARRGDDVNLSIEFRSCAK